MLEKREDETQTAFTIRRIVHEVRAHEREACAKIALAHYFLGLGQTSEGAARVSKLIAAGIRARADAAEAAGAHNEARQVRDGIAEIVRLRAENERLRKDAGILLACLDGLQEAAGETLDPEDAAIVEQIRAAPSPGCEGGRGT